MQAFVEQCLMGSGFSRQVALLRRLVRHPALHARFLNTLSRLEYVGVRKMLKARRAESLDLEGLRHILEETVHAIRLKKFAHAVAGDAICVDTYADAHTLAGDAAERYFQCLDRKVGEVAEPGDEACYWLTSAVIEVRARTFYPAYQEILEHAELPVSVASIAEDEADHLEQMAAELPRHFEDWRGVMGRLVAYEERMFGEYLDHVEAQLDQILETPAPD